VPGATSVFSEGVLRRFLDAHLGAQPPELVEPRVAKSLPHLGDGPCALRAFGLPYAAADLFLKRLRYRKEPSSALRITHDRNAPSDYVQSIRQMWTDTCTRRGPQRLASMQHGFFDVVSYQRESRKSDEDERNVRIFGPPLQ
jgi:hypothetical protein